MPLPIELSTNYWTQVKPEGKTQKVKALSFACFYYRTLSTPPPLASEGTEIAAAGEITMERSQAPYWFRTKKAAATEEQKPSILELQEPSLENVTSTQIESGSINAADLENEAVTEAKIKIGAVSENRLASPAVSGVKLVVVAVPTFLGGKGEQKLAALAATRKQTIALNAKETEKTYKVTHQLGEAVMGIFVIKTSTKAEVAGNKILKWESATKTEIEISSGTAVADKEEFYVTLIA